MKPRNKTELATGYHISIDTLQKRGQSILGKENWNAGRVLFGKSLELLYEELGYPFADEPEMIQKYL